MSRLISPYCFLVRHSEVFDRVFEFNCEVVTIGRSAANTLVLSSPMVSRQHAVLFHTDDGYVLRDLNSRNGTFINSQRIQEACVEVAEVIAIGPFSLTACLNRAAAIGQAIEIENSTLNQQACVQNSVALITQQLTDAQLRVFNELLLGKSEKEVATSLRISKNTVHSHARAIMNAFSVSSKLELFARCLADGSKDAVRM